MPLPACSSESGLDSDAHHLTNVSSSCASSAPSAVPPAPGPPAPGRIVFPLPGGLAHHHHYKALQQQAAAAAAAMSSGDNFVQAPGGGRTPAAGLISAPVHAIMPLPSRVVHDGRLWTSSFHQQQQQQQHQQPLQPQHDMASSLAAAAAAAAAACAARAHDDGGNNNNRMVDNNGPAAGAATEEHGSNNELGGGGSFAEHDYMSDVSSAPNDDTSNKCGERGGAMDGGKGDDAQDTDDSNLRETELRLGPPESAGLLLSGAKRGFSEAMGGLSDSKRSFSDTAAAAVTPSGHASHVLSSAEHKLLPLGVSPRNGGSAAAAAAAAAAASAYTDSRVSPMINSSPSPAAPGGSFADVRSTYFDSRPACLFDHYIGDGKQGGSCSGFRVPTRPPPWQVLDHSAASLGPFPSPKVPLDVSNSLSGKPGAADAPPVVGWPPVRAYRKSSLSSPTGGASAKPVAECANATSTPAPASAAAGAGASPAPAASPASPALVSGAQPPRPGMDGMPKGMRPTPAAGAENGCRASGAPSSSPSSVTSNHWFVKVYMDGVPFGRKVDLRIHGCYDKLSVGLEEMFTRYANVEQGSNGESKPLKFLQGSDYVLTYEDQDGDLMLVGDVPWNMFITSVKRLRIMKSSEAVGIAPRNSPKLWKVGAA